MRLVWTLGQGEELKLLRRRGQWLCQVRIDPRCSEQNTPRLDGHMSATSKLKGKKRQTSNQSAIGNLHTMMYFISSFETAKDRYGR
jgi:hypothetical protein